MTEKRFTIIDKQFISYYGGDGHQISDGECKFWLWHNKEESQKVCDKLNNLIDENEQLKQSNERIVKDIELALGFIRHNGYSLQDIKDYEDAKKEYEEDLAYYRKGDVE